MTGSDPLPRRLVGWRGALALALGHPDGPDRRSFALAGAVLLGVVPLATLHSAITASGATVLSAGMFVLCAGVAVFGTVVLIAVYRTPDEGEDGDGDGDGDEEPAATDPAGAAGRHGLVVVWGLAALLYGVEALSALCAFLLDDVGGLGAARRFFLWHVADTVPVFTVTDTFGIDRPVLPLDVAGVLALALKVALILPLVRIAVATFRVVDRSGGAADGRGFQVVAPGGSGPAGHLAVWRSAVQAILVIAVCGGALSGMLTICNWLGPLTQGIAAVLSPTAGRWVRAAGDGLLEVMGILLVQAAVLTVLSVVLTATTWFIVRGLLRADLGVLSRVTVGLAVVAASLTSLLLVFATAAAADLLTTCLAEGRPPMIQAADRLEWFAWHSMDVLPEWSVPGVLDWKKPDEPGSWWSGVLLVLAKLVAVLIIAVPVARVVRAARRTWPESITRATGPR